MAKNILPRQRRERLIRRALLSTVILSVLAVLTVLTGTFRGKGATPVVAENSESEATVSDVLEVLETSLAEQTTSETITTETTTTVVETTTTLATIPLNTGTNLVLTDEDLNTRFVLPKKHLNAHDGVCIWESDQGGVYETYYDLPMRGVFDLPEVKALGYTYDEDVAERSDGVWCIKRGEDEREWLVLVAMNLKKFPRGTLVRTSVGFGIVVDTDTTFSGNEIDIAVSSKHWGGTDKVFEE